jgi:hypothetical protein
VGCVSLCAGTAKQEPSGSWKGGRIRIDFTVGAAGRYGRRAVGKSEDCISILAEKPETVAACVVPRILDARKNGTPIMC